MVLVTRNALYTIMGEEDFGYMKRAPGNCVIDRGLMLLSGSRAKQQSATKDVDCPGLWIDMKISLLK